MIRLTNIERFATHDGPGIRTTFFFKGCHMHCPWCANPETWKTDLSLMHDQKKCVGCQMCMQVCPTKAIRVDDSGFHYQADQCIRCRKCEQECLEDAIEFSGNDYDIDELVAEALKDKDYYEESNGGITLSGGEVFMQYEGLLELLQRLKSKNLSIALETTGSYPLEKLKNVEPYVDLFLMDLKHVDADKLKKVTGGNAQQIMENFIWLAEQHPEKVIIRVPVIPRFNNDEETIQEIIDFAHQHKIQEVDLLPFHPLGKAKWERLGIPYPYSQDKMMEEADLQKYIRFGQDREVTVKIGG